MTKYNTNQRSVRLNYISIDSRTGTLSTVLDGRVVHKSNIERWSDTRRPLMIDGKPYTLVREIKEENVVWVANEGRDGRRPTAVDQARGTASVGQGGAPANTDRAEGLRRKASGLCPWHDAPEFGCEPCADIINAKHERKP